MPERSRQPLGFALRDAYPWHDLAALARMGEDAGFDALFLPEVGARDTLATLAALAGETTRLRLGTGVVPLPSRSPALLAIAAATVQERSGGRLLLGLGTGPSGPGALDRLRATVGALREAFAGGPARSRARRSGRRCRCAPRRRCGSRRSARGPLPWPARSPTGSCSTGAPPERVAAAVTQIAEGARAAGRDPADITVAVYVRAALVPGSLEGAARDGGRVRVLPGVRAAVRHDGRSTPADPGRRRCAGVMLTDRGSATARLDAYRAAGADLPVVYPVLPPGETSADAARSTLEAVAPA